MFVITKEPKTLLTENKPIAKLNHNLIKMCKVVFIHKSE